MNLFGSLKLREGADDRGLNPTVRCQYPTVRPLYCLYLPMTLGYTVAAGDTGTLLVTLGHC